MSVPYDRGSGRGRGPSGRTERVLNDEERSTLGRVIGDGDALATIQWADQIGRTLVQGGLTTSQIRNVFGEVRQIQLTWGQHEARAYRRAVLLIPKISYQAARVERQGREGMEELQRVLVPALELVAESKGEDRRSHFMRFADFFEAILAYHKKYGGRD